MRVKAKPDGRPAVEWTVVQARDKSLVTHRSFSAATSTKGASSSVQNYRPISLTCIASKIME